VAKPKQSAAAAQAVALDQFSFYRELLAFYQQNRRPIRSKYQDLSKKFLDFNDPAKGTSYLRTPQFEALEIYIFLKEFLENKPLHEIFLSWRDSTGPFEGRVSGHLFDQTALYDPIFQQLRKNATRYPNYIFALTMGTGKTILMATCIFYEFLLANKFQHSALYSQNALVFAPDKTVLQSLREIQTFDMGKVVPPEYRNFLAANVKFHFLDEAGMTLSTTDNTRFNIIISNTQKIILKRVNKATTKAEQLFAATPEIHQTTGSAYDDLDDLYGEAVPQDSDSLATNQRFQKLQRLPQLGVYIDEAHHVFGTKLKSSMTALRTTVDELAASLEQAGTHVVACYNYTGTPYIGQEVLPEVVYAYGLKEAIDKGYLKKIRVNTFQNTKDAQFVAEVVEDFLRATDGLRPENLPPKLAFFATTVDELNRVLRPHLEAELDKRGIPRSQILVNVGDDRLTKNEDLRDFYNLDVPGTAGSEKRFVLLVNKGREGWNCRSLFGVAMFREPKSKIFVLQASMRCLRAIGDIQHTGRIYLTEANKAILDAELQQNFRITLKDAEASGTSHKRLTVRPSPPPRSVKLKRIHKLFALKEKQLKAGIDLELAGVDVDTYKSYVTTTDGIPGQSTLKGVSKELAQQPQRQFSELTLVAEIARYVNRKCSEIQVGLEESLGGVAPILELVNQHNRVLYDHIIPRLFQELFDVREYKDEDEVEVLLVKDPPLGFYEVTANEQMVTRKGDVSEALQDKSFHLDLYAFDSVPEKQVFTDLLNLKEVMNVYFTGMLTHGQSDFFVQYIDPESNTVRRYFPDFLVQKTDGSYLIIEVKGDNKLDDPVVLAKQSYAQQLAAASQMTYHMVRSSNVAKGLHWEDLGFPQYQPAQSPSSSLFP
jgi:type III restriction enzyme